MKIFIYHFRCYSFLGGWLQIGRFVTSTENDRGPQFYSNQLSDLHKAGTSNFLLNGKKFSDLKSFIGFTEYRVYCTKPYHGRINHAKFTNATSEGRSLFNYVTERSYKEPSNICKALEYMDDDSSRTKTLPCRLLKPRYNKFIDDRLYDNIWYGNGDSYLNIVTYLYCDDNNFESGFSKYGTWLYYVR